VPETSFSGAARQLSIGFLCLQQRFEVPAVGCDGLILQVSFGAM